MSLFWSKRLDWKPRPEVCDLSGSTDLRRETSASTLNLSSSRRSVEPLRSRVLANLFGGVSSVASVKGESMAKAEVLSEVGFSARLCGARFGRMLAKLFSKVSVG
jgi:hypothetical protein